MNLANILQVAGITSRLRLVVSEVIMMGITASRTPMEPGANR